MKLSEVLAQPEQPTALKLSDVSKPRKELKADKYSIFSEKFKSGRTQEELDELIDSRNQFFRSMYPAETAEKLISSPSTFHKQQIEFEKLQKEKPHIAKIIGDMGGVEKFLVGAGEGFTTLGRGVGLVDQADSGEKSAAEALRDTSLSATTGKIAAQASPFLIPAGGIANISSAAGRTAAMGGVGATEANIIARGEGGATDEILAATGLGLLVGTLGEVALPVISRMASRLAGRVSGEPPTGPLITPEGAPTPDFQQYLTQSGMTFDEFTEGAAKGFNDPVLNFERQQAFEDLGVPITEAERTRNTDLFNRQQDALRREGPVKTLYDTREQQLDTMAQQQVDQVGGVAERAATSALESVESKATYLDNQIGELYDQFRGIAPQVPAVKMNNAIDYLRSNAPQDTMAGGVIKALRGEMRNMGIMDKKWNASGRIDLKRTEQLRQFANKLYPNANGQGREILREFKAALDDDALAAMQTLGDVNAIQAVRQARRAKQNFEQELDPGKANKFDKRRVSLVRDMLENKIQPEDFVNKVINRSSNYKARDLQELKKYLTTGTEDQIKAGQQSWDDIRAAALQEIKDSAFVGPTTQAGTQTLSLRGIDKALKKIGGAKVNVLFSQAEKDFLKKLSKVAALKTPPPGTGTGSGPTSPAVKQLQSELRRRVPVLGGIYDSWVTARGQALDDKMVLQLRNDVSKIAEQNEKRKFLELRRALPGTAASTITTGAAAEVGRGSINEEAVQP